MLRKASRNATRFKSRATEGIRASAGSGAVEINRLDLPASLPKSSEVNIQFGLRGNADITVLDSDYCIPANLGNGVRTEVTIEGGVEVLTQETFCLPEKGNVNRVIGASIITPSRGSSFNITVTARGGDSGNLLARETYTVSLEGEDGGNVGTADCVSDGDCPAGQRCKDGSCVNCNILDRLLGRCGGGGGGGGLISPSIAVGGVLFLIVLIAILAP